MKRVGSVQKIVDSLATDASRRLAELSRESADESVRLSRIQNRLNEIEQKLTEHNSALNSLENRRRTLQQRIQVLATADVRKASDILKQIEDTPTAAKIAQSLANLDKYEFRLGSKTLGQTGQALQSDDGSPLQSDQGQSIETDSDVPVAASVPLDGVPRDAAVIARFEYEGSAPLNSGQVMTRIVNNGTTVRYNTERQRHEIDVTYVPSVSNSFRVNWIAVWPQKNK